LSQACRFIKNLQVQPPSVRHSHLLLYGTEGPVLTGQIFRPGLFWV
jgi:hypothetical protein